MVGLWLESGVNIMFTLEINKGGYIFHVDHRVPPDVSLKNYLYYLKKKERDF